MGARDSGVTDAIFVKEHKNTCSRCRHCELAETQKLTLYTVQRWRCSRRGPAPGGQKAFEDDLVSGVTSNCLKYLYTHYCDHWEEEPDD